MLNIAVISPITLALPEKKGALYEYLPDVSSLKKQYDYVLVATKHASIQTAFKTCCEVAAVKMPVSILMLDAKGKTMGLELEIISIKDLGVPPMANNQTQLRAIYGDDLAAIIERATDLETARNIIAHQYNEDASIVLTGCEMMFCAKCMSLYNRTIVDKLLDNKPIAILVFLLMMYGMFWFSVVVGGSLQSKTNDTIHYIIETIAPEQDGVLRHIYYAFAGGIETIISFIPLLGCMYLFIAMLEESGYMARAISMIDGLLVGVGLSGDAFVPLITGFGCNVPAINSAGKIDDFAQRVTTVMMVPFMACGGRLSVFILLSTVFFADNSTAIVFALYLAGIMMAFCTSIVFSSIVFSGKSKNVTGGKSSLKPLVWPNPIKLIRISISNTVAFVVSSGKMIAILFACVYLLNTVTGDSVTTPAKDGMLVRGGKFIAPIFSPIGIAADNWPAAVSILTGIIAKESVVGSVKAIYGDRDEGARQMRAKFDGKLGAFAYLLFILLYFPCASVFFSIAKQLNYWWAMVSVLWSTIMAYAVSASVYQLGGMLLNLSAEKYIVIIFISLATFAWYMKKREVRI